MKDIISHKNKTRHIIVSDDVYQQIRNQGKLGDTFNDVVKRLLGINNTTTAENLQDKGEK